MSDKSPRSKMSKAQGKSLKEKRAEKKAESPNPPRMAWTKLCGQSRSILAAVDYSR
ncbi:hypothetical protein F6W96_04210 [Nocardia terpenica]|uniref:Uncharacterized protein n=1 Tax=Nocardia terpenica TaxID=455432 RepID=A0A6G9YWM8_9NOCA|nr:hypothetical protein F6W96_04210 [Nocardia terpenica]